MHYNKPQKETAGRLLGRSWCKITGSTETSSEVA